MKKIIIALVICGFALTAQAQGVKGGIKLGLNLANQSLSLPSGSASADGITSFHGGLYMTAMFSPVVGIQPELLYSIVGAQSGSGSSNTKTTYSYLSIPVLVRFNVAPVINLHVGPQFGLNLAATATQGSNSQSLSDGVNTLDMGLAFGGGFDLPGGFNGGIRYCLGLTNIAKDAPSGYSLKNNVFQIYIGFKLFGD